MLGAIGLSRDSGGGSVTIVGDDHPRLSVHRIGGASAAALASLGVAVAALWRARGGPGQDVSVDTDRAVQALRTIRYCRKSGRTLPIGDGPLSTYHRTADGRWIYVYAQHVLGHFLDAALDVLQCPHTADAVAAAIARWDGLALEDALNARGVPAALVRTDAEWAAHPQGRWLAARPVVEVERIGDGPPEPWPAGRRPLAGVRVLDVTHALCGPYAARALAEQGADVLRIASTECRDPEAVLIDTGWGKRSAYLDLRDPHDASAALALAADGDVVVQSFRPGALDRHGLSADAVAAARPGIVYLSASGYGRGGPWAGRGAYESLGQAVAGISAAEALDGRPRSVRTGTLNDYLAAYLGAAGVVAALWRRARDGGSYHVSVSLARTSMWVRGLGPVPGAADHLACPYEDPVPPSTFTMASPFGPVTALGPVVGYTETPGSWARPPVPLGSGPAAWLPRSAGVGG